MRNEKILVVEFEENSLNLLLEILQTEGFQVVTAKDGHEGLLMFESENPDLVILEPMLLKLHGFDLCRKISKDSNRKTPVIITTGFYKGEHYKSEAIETFGAAAFFEKPYENEALMTTIHELLGNGTAAGVKEIKKESREEKAAAIDIEKSVEEMEKSIRQQETSSEEKPSDSSKKKGQRAITTEVDEMLQDALSDFGLSLEKKPGDKKPDIRQTKEEVKKKEPPVVKQEAQESHKEAEAEDVKLTEEMEEETELQTEELIEELIQKEEQIEEEEKPEKKPDDNIVMQKQEEKAEEIKEKEPEEEIKGKEEEGDQKIFEDYFEEPEKTPVRKNLFGFLKKVKKPLPLMIGSTAFVVLVAAGATYYFLKPNKPQTPTNQRDMQPISNVERSTSALDQQEGMAPATQGDASLADPSGGPTLEGGEGTPAETTNLDDNSAITENAQESTSEFMSTTGLSSGRREVMLPDSAPPTESRQFEIIEVEEADEEQLGESKVEIRSPQLEETAKNLIQPENSSDRIKTGDLVPIESVDVPPVAIKKINPKYPPVAFRRGIEETVVFRALISEFGNVLDVAFVDPAKTSSVFRKSCDEAVRQWKFSPAKKNGVNVKVWKMFSITFKKNKTE